MTSDNYFPAMRFADDSVFKAFLIAMKAHNGQVDKSGQRYILHPVRMMTKFTEANLQCVALLHDVLEDSDYTPEDLLAEGMSIEVVFAVCAVTHMKNEPRADYYERVKQNPLALLVGRPTLSLMCTTIVLPNGDWIQSVAQVKAQGWDIAGLTNADSDNECLCNTDAEGVLMRAGLDYVEDVPGFLDLVSTDDASLTDSSSSSD
jgi:hypothetical protein